MATLEQRLQGTLGAQLLTIIKLETAVDELTEQNQEQATQIAALYTAQKETKCSQQSQE